MAGCGPQNKKRYENVFIEDILMRLVCKFSGLKEITNNIKTSGLQTEHKEKWIDMEKNNF